jgi:hypothetical protein
MTSILKAQKANEAKGKRKRKSDAMDVDEDEPAKKKNKQRVLLLSSRGITHRMRQLMNDLEALLPHVKKGTCQVGIKATSYLYFFLGNCRRKTGLKISITSLTRTCGSA